MKQTNEINNVPLRPCVRCGFCCIKARCFYSFKAEGKLYKDPFEALDEPKQCPWLEHKDGKYHCKIAKKYKRELGIGEGCCSLLNSKRKAFITKSFSS